jgi:hypothetical protein
VREVGSPPLSAAEGGNGGGGERQRHAQPVAIHRLGLLRSVTQPLAYPTRVCWCVGGFAGSRCASALRSLPCSSENQNSPLGLSFHPL